MTKVASLSFLAVGLLGVPQGTTVSLQPTSPGTAQTGHLNISGTATVGLLKSQGTVFGASTAPTGFAYGGFFTAASNQGRGFYGFASSPTGLTYGGFFQNASESGRAVYGLATSTTGFNYGGYFQTASSDGRGLLGVAASPTGTTYGVYGTAASPDGYGVYSEGKMHATGIISGNGSGISWVNAYKLSGHPSTDFQMRNAPVYAETSGTGSNAIFGKATGSGSTTGVYGDVTGPSGRAMVANASSTTGSTRGILARTYSPNGTAVYGQSSATSGTARAFYGTSASADAWVAEFRATSTTGYPYALLASSYADDGYAFFAQALATTGSTGAIYGRVDAPNAIGISTNGRFVAAGTKSFQIDHPQDPANKYLTHYCTESPSPQNSYSGNVVTDGRGYAWVNLPDYFEDINANFKYQLTVVDDGDNSGFVMAKVSRVIDGNRFQIRTSEPRASVSWRVEADRNDRYVRANPQKDVSDKGPREKGKYVQPELYGMPRSAGESYVHMDSSMSTDGRVGIR